MKKILITGASGFVGKELCSVLNNRNIPFIASVRQRPAQNQIQVGDLTEATEWSDALKGCDVVIHLAARVHVMKDKSLDPITLYRKVNVEATLNLARQAANLGVRRFIFISSVKVVGETTTDKPFGPRTTPWPLDAYGQSKLEAEIALTSLSRETGMELVIIRPPLIYGPGVRANFLKLMNAVRLGVPMPFRNVLNRRSLAALDNVVDLIVLCVFHPKAAGEIFMVSDDNDLSISELIFLIGKYMGKRPVLLPMPFQLFKLCGAVLGKSGVVDRLIGSLQVDVTQTKECLGWRPPIDTEAAIEKTVLHFLGRR